MDRSKEQEVVPPEYNWLDHKHMKIITFPDDALRYSTLAVEEGEASLPNVIRHLVANLERSGTGIGLAANQIGFAPAMFVMDPDRSKTSFNPVVIANPKFTGSGLLVDKQEGCLSFPGVFERVKRYDSIHAEFDLVDPRTYQFTHVSETLTGLAAHVFQHESEHLIGKLMIDHLDAHLQMRVTRKMEKRKTRGW
jgi:peptide deformylase